MVAILGWFGSILYLLNHGYISIIKNWHSGVYYGGNFLAAISLVLSSFLLGSYQAVVINAFWAIISLLLLVKFDVSRLAFSKRIFYVGFASFILFCGWLSFKHGMFSETLYVYLGWSSTYVFCLSYFLFSSKKLSHVSYLMLNVYAATALLPLLWSQQNWPVFTLEVCWALISGYGVFVRIDEVHLID